MARLAELFRSHPAWREAAQSIDDRATSRVFFSHRPGEAWRLERREGETWLCRGDDPDPDFVFRFTPVAVDRLAAVEGGVGDFAVTLFEAIVAPDPEARVGFRIVAPFGRLVRRGYLSLLVRGGPKVLAFGAAHGVRTLGALRKLVARVRSQAVEDWEDPGRDSSRRGD